MFPVASLMLRRSGLRVLLLLLVLCIMSGCDTIAGALPPQPTPFPTFARLATVTPVLSSPTPDPTSTPRASPTPAILEGTVAVGANVRSGPGLTFNVVGSVATGGQVLLRGRRDGWYQVTAPDGTEGWMSAQVLNLPPQAPTTVPTVIP